MNTVEFDKALCCQRSRIKREQTSREPSFKVRKKQAGSLLVHLGGVPGSYFLSTLKTEVSIKFQNSNTILQWLHHEFTIAQSNMSPSSSSICLWSQSCYKHWEKKLWFYKSAGAKTSSDLMIEEHAIIRVCVEKNSVCLLCALEFLVQDCVALGPDGHVDVWGWVIFWSGEREREKEREDGEGQSHVDRAVLADASIRNKQHQQ